MKKKRMSLVLEVLGGGLWIAGDGTRASFYGGFNEEK